MRPMILYHANCTDGLTAAWVMLRSLGDAEVVPAFYGTDPPDVTGRHVYILDFSYKRPVMERLCEQAETVFVLDHHKTAQADLDGLDSIPNDHVSIIFDMNRSGAQLAWDWVRENINEHCPPDRFEWLIDYVQDRDLWRWALPDSRLVSAAIEAYPRTFEAWDELARRTTADMVAEGVVIERYRERCIEAAADLARYMVIGGHRVLAANSSEMRFASDTAHRLCEGNSFAATYWIRADGIVQFSLRSDEHGSDVSEIAKGYGGGGHRHAAGFQLSGADFSAMLLASEAA